MLQNHHNHQHQPPSTTPATITTTRTTTRPSTPCILLSTTLLSLLLILSYTSSSPHPSLPPPHPSLFPPDSPYRHLFLSTTKTTSDKTNQNPPAPPPPPSIAYLLSGSSNDTGRILRLLFSIYHPRNTYLLHLDSTASQAERDDLAFKIQSFPLFKAAQNVNVVGKANVVYQLGPSSVSAVLHGASILLRISKNWDWFINLSVDDYPLVTQDDLLHILSYLPKDLNFINHTSYIGWIESRKLKPIIVDPGLYLSEENEVFYATQKRVLPDAFRLFTGSSSAILSRKFLEFCTLGTDNLPRTVLMYLANTPSSNSVYFPTILCNSRQFNRTTINHNLQYVSLNSRKELHLINSSYYNDVVQSGAAFASRFLPDDPILDRIDQEILHRGPGKPVPGGWCLGESGLDSCQVWGDAAVLQPGPGAKRLERCLLGILSEGTFRSQQCAGNRRSTAARSAGSNSVDHPPSFSCYCFRCYMSYWVRWDSSPNRQLIHEIIDAYEDGLQNKKEKSRKDRRKSRGSVNLGSSGELNRSELSPSNKEFTESEISVEEASPRSNGGDDVDGGEEDEEMEKCSMRRFVSFLGEKIWGVWT